jgi:hypothetical protein
VGVPIGSRGYDYLPDRGSPAAPSTERVKMPLKLQTQGLKTGLDPTSLPHRNFFSIIGHFFSQAIRQPDYTPQINPCRVFLASGFGGFFPEDPNRQGCFVSRPTPAQPAHASKWLEINKRLA